MASIKEIRTRIKSVESTLKITNAMYLIASGSLRKAREQLRLTQPYFQKIQSAIADILHHSPRIEHAFFDRREDIEPTDRKVGLIVISGDRGLAGAYNHNILKLAAEKVRTTSDAKMLMVGQMGRLWAKRNDLDLLTETEYSPQNPSLELARELGRVAIDAFLRKQLDEVYLVYTKMVTPLQLEPVVTQLLPLKRELFPYESKEKAGYPPTVTYLPSEGVVMDRLAPGYCYGTMLGALVESFCSEQSARMTAMDSSSKNAKDMLKMLTLSYNRARQSAITQEISEVVGGAMAGNS